MKTLFIIVSIIAAVYLAVQTFMQSSMLEMLSETVFVKSESAQKKTFAKPVLPAASSLEKEDKEIAEKQIDSNLMLTKNLEEENKVLASRIERLEKNVIELTNRLAEQASLSVNDTQAPSLALNSKGVKKSANYQLQNKDPKQMLPTATKPNDVQEKSSNGTLVVSSSHEDGQTKQNEQQKRLQQQATLRELANRLELTALSSLTN